MADLNQGLDMNAYAEFKQSVIQDSTRADRNKIAVAHWVQGEESRVEMGGKQVNIGADDGLNSMEMALASLAACDAAMVALHASFMGLKVNSITAEFHGHFNVAAYLGIDDAPAPGYDDVSSTIIVDAPDATPEQIAHLQHVCETRSPVGSTFALVVPSRVEVKAKKG